jgi:hypothetical protein
VTPIIVATHIDGVVRLYYRADDGALSQTGQLVAEHVEPTALATLAADLGLSLGWAPAAKPKRESPALPRRTRGPDKAKRASRIDSEQRRQAILAYIAAHPGLTSGDIARRLYPDEPFASAQSAVRKAATVLAVRGEITQTHATGGRGQRAWKYHATQPA